MDYKQFMLFMLKISDLCKQFLTKLLQERKESTPIIFKNLVWSYYLEIKMTRQVYPAREQQDKEGFQVFI